LSDTCAGRRGTYLFDANQSGAIEFRSFVGCCYWVPPVTLAEIYVPLPRPSRKLPPSPGPSLIVIFSCLIMRFVCRMISGIQRKPPASHPLLPRLKLPRPLAVPSHARSSFRNFLREELGENNDDEEMQDMINQADGDGEISHNEEEGQLP
jgi:hypothetical protein